MNRHRTAFFWWALAFVVGGVLALSYTFCGDLRAEAEPTITLSRAKWAEVMRVLVQRRVELEKVRAERNEARALLRIERNASLSKLAARDLEIAALRKQIANARADRCVGWQVATGVALGVMGVCGVMLTVREVTK